MKPYNFQVIEKPGESQERLIKRFLNKTSRSNIVQMCIENTSYTSKSQKNRKKKTRKVYIKRKIQEEYENSLKSNFSEK